MNGPRVLNVILFKGLYGEPRNPQNPHNEPPEKGFQEPRFIRRSAENVRFRLAGPGPAVVEGLFEMKEQDGYDSGTGSFTLNESGAFIELEFENPSDPNVLEYSATVAGLPVNDPPKVIP